MCKNKESQWSDNSLVAIGFLCVMLYPLLLTRTPWTGYGQRKEQIYRLFTACCVQPFHDELSESHCLAASQPERYGNNHFKAVHVITNPAAFPDVSQRFLFRQFIVLVYGSNSLTNIAAEHVECIGHLLLRHPDGSGRHRDRPVFSNCDYSSFHTHLSAFFVNPLTFLTCISLSMSSDILSSVTFAYVCVVRIFVCPIILLMLSIGIPADISRVPNVWRL